MSNPLIEQGRGLEVEAVSAADRRVINQAFKNPLEIPPIFKGWMEAYLEPLIKERVDRAIGAIPDFSWPAWQTYTPAWTSSGTAPALGNGTLLGRYVQHGKLVVVTGILVAGTTTTYGTGAWAMSLPVTAETTIGGTRGTVLASDSSAAAAYGAQSFLASSTTLNFYSNATPAVAFTNLVPFTWANTDVLRFLATYEAA